MSDFNNLDDPVIEKRDQEVLPKTEKEAPLLLEGEVSKTTTESAPVEASPSPSQPLEPDLAISRQPDHAEQAPLPVIADDQRNAEQLPEAMGTEELPLAKESEESPANLQVPGGDEENSNTTSPSEIEPADRILEASANSEPLVQDKSDAVQASEVSSTPDQTNLGEEESSSEKQSEITEISQDPLLLELADDSKVEQALTAELEPALVAADDRSLPVVVENSVQGISESEPFMQANAPEAENPEADQSAFGTETILVDGQPVQTRTYKDATGTWYEAFPLLRSLSWMPKSSQEKFVRRWIPRQNTQLVVQSNISTSKTTHLNEEGLRQLLSQIEVIKPFYTEHQHIEKSKLSPTLRKNTEEVPDPIKNPIPLFPKGRGVAELLIGDNIVNTAIYVDDSGTWFGTQELLANTKYGNRRDIGKQIRRMLGLNNIRNIEQPTPNGTRGKLYTNEDGLRALLRKLGKTLELVALQEPKNTADEQNSVPVLQTTSTSNAPTARIFTIGNQRAALRTSIKDNETWVSASDLLSALHLSKKKGTRNIVKNFVDPSEMQELMQLGGNGSRPQLHVNMQGARKIIEAISKRKGFNIPPDQLLVPIENPPAEQLSSPGETNLEKVNPPTSQTSSQSESPFGVAFIAVNGMDIPTRTYTDTSGVWYNVNDLLIESGLKTQYAKGLLMNRLNKEDVRLIEQPTRIGLRLMSHVNEAGLNFILSDLKGESTSPLDTGTIRSNALENSAPVPATGEIASSASQASRPLKANDPYGTASFEVEGKPIQARTYRNEAGLWFSARELINASKYANRHDGSKLLKSIVGDENVALLPQKTSNGERSVYHISEKGLGMLLKDINGKLIEEGGYQQTSFPLNTTSTNPASLASTLADSFLDTSSADLQKNIPATSEASTQQDSALGATSNQPSPFGLSTVSFKGKEVEVPTYVDNDGVWYCVYGLLHAAGRITSSARSTTMKRAIKNGVLRLINRPAAKGRNNYSHVDKVGLDEVLSELTGFRVRPQINVISAGTPEKERSHEDFLFHMEDLAGPPKPAPVVHKKQPVFDERRLGATAPRPGDNSGVFTAGTVSIDKQKLMVKVYTDNHKSWYATPDMFELVGIIDKEKRNEFLAEHLDRSDIKFVWQQYSDGVKRQPHVQTAALQVLVNALDQVAIKARQAVQPPVAGQKPEVVPTALTGLANKEQSQGWKLPGTSGNAPQTIQTASSASNASGVGNLSTATPGISSTPVQANGNDTNVLGSTTIELFGKPVLVKTTTYDNALWYSAVDLIDGFNAIEEAEGLPIVKKSEISKYVKAVADEQNVRKLYQKSNNQPGTRESTHINGNGLEQFKAALAVTRAGGKPYTAGFRRSASTSEPLPRTPTPVQTPSRPIVESAPAQVVPAPVINPPQPLQPSMPVAPRWRGLMSYGTELVNLPNGSIQIRSVTDADGKWYAFEDILERTGIAKGSAEHKFVQDSLKTGITRSFWQSGPFGITKINHVDLNGLYEALNAVQLLAQRQRLLVQSPDLIQAKVVVAKEPKQAPTATKEKVQKESRPYPKVRESLCRSTEVVPFNKRDANWLKADEARRGIVSFNYNGLKVRFVKDSAGVVYVHGADMMPFIQSRVQPDASFVDPNGFVKVWTPSLKSTCGAIYMSMDNLAQAITRVNAPGARPFYEWCVQEVEPKMRAQPLVPLDL
ncbi:MAG: hypothetical protein LUC43_01210 [Burkholderiales bacterium]|nr:hypothetical protein [Burkholderiales bacterium]